MNPRAALQTLLLLLLTALPCQAQAITPAEKAKIEALISHLENLKDASFVRNGKDYDAQSAAQFLRKKWNSQQSEINSATDFIAKAATVSSTSGKPYMIRLKGTPETPCGPYLTTQLRNIEAAAPAM
jgi:hypothetical protein